MSDALTTIDPRHRALTAPRGTPEATASLPEAPPAAPPPAPGTTWGPHDRVPLRDAEAEC